MDSFAGGFEVSRHLFDVFGESAFAEVRDDVIVEEGETSVFRGDAVVVVDEFFRVGVGVVRGEVLRDDDGAGGGAAVNEVFGGGFEVLVEAGEFDGGV